jgi:glycosyltransferase involved in cell wall biosynthesis
MNRRIWIISELFFPNESATGYILTEIAKAFTSKYEVNVICADTNYENDTNRVAGDNGSKTIPGINIVRVHVRELDKNSLPKRLLRFFSVNSKLYQQALKEVKSGDIVFAVTNPAPLLLSLQKLKKKKNIEYILLVHDVFPENALASGIMKNTPLYTFVKKRFDKAYAAADKILVLGEDMKEIISSKIGFHDNVFVCENWGEESIKPSARPMDGKIILQYAGNMGRVQGLENLLSIISDLKNEKLLFDFWGSGALVPYFNNFVSENSMGQVRIRGSYNRGTQNEVLNDCDIAIVCLAKGMKGLGVPSKTYNILAAGKPILYIGDEGSEIYNLVKDNDLGPVFGWDRTEELIEWLNALTINDLDNFKEKGKRSRALYESRYTKEIILKKILETVYVK